MVPSDPKWCQEGLLVSKGLTAAVGCVQAKEDIFIYAYSKAVTKGSTRWNAVH